MADRIESEAILGAIASLACALGLRTTAEGVETSEQCMRARRHGFRDAQGFLFGAARPQAETVQMLRDGIYA